MLDVVKNKDGESGLHMLLDFDGDKQRFSKADGDLADPLEVVQGPSAPGRRDLLQIVHQDHIVVMGHGVGPDGGDFKWRFGGLDEEVHVAGGDMVVIGGYPSAGKTASSALAEVKVQSMYSAIRGR